MEIMSDSAPNFSLSYRQEVLSKLFDYIRSTESCYLIGAASIGKTRLLDFLMFPEVKRHYLGEEAARTWIVRVDLNRLIPKKDEIFSFFELMLSSLVLEFSKQEGQEFEEIKVELAGLDSQVIQSGDPLLAVRFFEWEVTKLCQMQKYKICFLFDEIDEFYKKASREIFALLRAVRDANKPYLCYALLLRNLPEKLRKPSEVESFYELHSRNLIGIGPFSREDTLEIIRQIADRRRQNLQPEIREWLAATSGGHPGLVQALLSTIIDTPASQARLNEIEWFAEQELIKEECRKIWNGLTDEERAGLKAYFEGNTGLPLPTLKILHAKGLLKRDSNACFSPLFERYIKEL
jgi:hypothetical protein